MRCPLKRSHGSAWAAILFLLLSLVVAGLLAPGMAVASHDPEPDRPAHFDVSPHVADSAPGNARERQVHSGPAGLGSMEASPMDGGHCAAGHGSSFTCADDLSPAMTMAAPAVPADQGGLPGVVPTFVTNLHDGMGASPGVSLVLLGISRI